MCVKKRAQFAHGVVEPRERKKNPDKGGKSKRQRFLPSVLGDTKGAWDVVDAWFPPLFLFTNSCPKLLLMTQTRTGSVLPLKKEAQLFCIPAAVWNAGCPAPPAALCGPATDISAPSNHLPSSLIPFPVLPFGKHLEIFFNPPPLPTCPPTSLCPSSLLLLHQDLDSRCPLLSFSFASPHHPTGAHRGMQGRHTKQPSWHNI